MQAKMDITKDISGQVMVNFADFKDNPQTKVLEIATVKYFINNYLNLQIGQFRPYFGAEDLYSFDVHRSYNWSNQYSLFSRNNWQSFQLGAAIFGSLEDKKIPLKYFYTISNANGKNQNGDNDNDKSHSLRLEYRPAKNMAFAINGATTRHQGQAANAIGGDISYEKPLHNRWIIGVDGEYKKGTNILAYDASKTINKNLKDYEMQGVYVTPLIRKGFDGRFFDAVELSCRYEYLEDLTHGGNPSRSYVPMVSLLLNSTYASRLSFISNFTNYNRQIKNSSQSNSSQFLVQYQFRY